MGSYRLLVAPRRGNREGSIVRRKDGMWQGAVTLVDGRRKYLYGGSREEIRRKVASALHSIDTGTLSDSHGITVGDFLDQWLAEVVKPSVRHWTFTGYEVHVRLHLKPTVGTIPLDKLTPLHVQQLVNGRIAAGMSPRSVRYIRGTLRTALNQAMHWGLISRNAASLVSSPRVEHYEIKPFTPDEARSFLSAIKGDRLAALYSVALTMGLRQGEALGLQWHDVDLEMGYLRISKQLQRIDGKFQILEAKTARSRRTLALPASIVDALRAHRIRQQEERRILGAPTQKWDLVFTTENGRPIDGTVVSHHFHRVLERAGLQQRRFHDLRHSCATLLLVQGVSPRVVMDVLGHSQIALTMNTYSHVIPELKRDAATRMDDLIADRDR
jgi:integrase